MQENNNNFKCKLDQKHWEFLKVSEVAWNIPRISEMHSECQEDTKHFSNAFQFFKFPLNKWFKKKIVRLIFFLVSEGFPSKNCLPFKICSENVFSSIKINILIPIQTFQPLNSGLVPKLNSISVLKCTSFAYWHKKPWRWLTSTPFLSFEERAWEVFLLSFFLREEANKENKLRNAFN